MIRFQQVEAPAAVLEPSFGIILHSLESRTGDPLSAFAVAACGDPLSAFAVAGCGGERFMDICARGAWALHEALEDLRRLAPSLNIEVEPKRAENPPKPMRR